MTLVYERPSPTPVTHCLVIGCGRFSQAPANWARRSPPAGARAFAQAMIDRADDLVAPLGTIEMLISDPDEASGWDTAGLAISHASADPRLGGTLVDPVRMIEVQAAGRAWLARCRPRDVLVLYAASHGFADDHAAAYVLLEDVDVGPLSPWHQVLNIHQTTLGLCSMPAETAWVFVDACQEVGNPAASPMGGGVGFALATVTVQQLATCVRRPVGLAACGFGGTARAQVQGQPPDFTRALIKSFDGGCVEPKERGWRVTAKSLLYDVGKVAQVALDCHGVRPFPFSGAGVDAALLNVAKPMLPVSLSTNVQAHLRHATQVNINDSGSVVLARSPSPDLVWRFEIDAQIRTLSASISFDAAWQGPSYGDESLLAFPPARDIIFK